MNESLAEEWFAAAIDGDDKRVAELLIADANLVTLVDERNSDSKGKTALHHAAEGGNEKVVARLLAACPALVNVNAAGNNTALDFAAENGHAGVVGQLLAAKADPIVPAGDVTSLHLAAVNGHEQVVALLLAANPELAGAVMSDEKATALHFAAGKGSEKAFSHLLAVRPDLIDAVTTHGLNVMHFAASLGQDNMVEPILALRPDMITASMDTDKMEPLPLALSAGHLNIAEKLLAIKPELVRRVGADGNTVLHWAIAGKGFTTEFAAKVFQMWPEALHCPNRDHRTPLNHAFDYERDLFELFRWKASLDELCAAGGRNRPCFRMSLRPVMEQQCETLYALLPEGVVGIVFEFMGFPPLRRGQKRAHEGEERDSSEESA